MKRMLFFIPLEVLEGFGLSIYFEEYPPTSIIPFKTYRNLFKYNAYKVTLTYLYLMADVAVDYDGYLIKDRYDWFQIKDERKVKLHPQTNKLLFNSYRGWIIEYE